jgi:hypothetical protein
VGKPEKMGDGGQFKRSLGSTRGTSRPGYKTQREIDKSASANGCKGGKEQKRMHT